MYIRHATLITFFDFINEVIVKFIFWKLLETFEIGLEASNPHVARTPNLQKLFFGCISNIPLALSRSDEINAHARKRTDVASLANYLKDCGASGDAD